MMKGGSSVSVEGRGSPLVKLPHAKCKTEYFEEEEMNIEEIKRLRARCRRQAEQDKLC